MSPAARRATGLLLIGLVLAVTCTLLGRWQWNRHVWREGAIAVVETNWSADPVPLDRVLDDPADTLTDADVWRRVTVVGQYEPAGTVLLRNRPVGGTPAYHVLVPFVVSDASAGGPADTLAGTVLVVDRGWVPLGADGSADVTPPAPPTGTVTLTARLRHDEPASTRSAPAGQVQAISTSDVLAAGGVPGETLDAYLALTSEEPSVAQLPGQLPPPSTDPGSHLSYAFQWWTFALGGLVAFGIAARRELQDERAERDVEGPAAVEPAPVTVDGVELWPTRDTPRTAAPRRPAAPDVPRRRGGRDEDLEDALIDAQLGDSAPSDGR
ncbi:SURF1 family cytochrome oxidase biogenesis protein [Cellulomonas fengjieae]|uniref:SURF1 family cytochrome oxidase biogenesis protein n=1 Tax=Cellulomonas fengjieae TaxID=2819978 RepID=UPI001AB016A9|nr:SURF1 family protein [Cellulomonas fengjieae]MBO3103008.1 SURF1 family protein [Cellulomonas fengjieae]